MTILKEHQLGVDAFVIPEGRLAAKQKSIRLFLKFAISEEGYKAFLEPREWYPRSYLLPAVESMPALQKYREQIDDSFPMIDHQLYRGVDKAGEAIEAMLSE